MKELKLRSYRHNGRWYKVTSFKEIDKLNQFLEQSPDYGLLAEKQTYDGQPVYIAAKTSDKGQEKLALFFESEDTGYCAKYYKAECGRLFVLIPDGLHTCQDDAWREPCNSVEADLFTLHETQTA